MTDTVGGLPPLLSVGMRVAAVPPLLKESRWHEVMEVHDEGGSGQLVRLSGVDNISHAKALAGLTLLAPVDSLPADFALHDVDALLGREVEDDVLGPLGSITEVMRGAANDVWVVEGPFGEVLLAVVDEVVKSVPAEGPVIVHAPTGSVETGKGE